MLTYGMIVPPEKRSAAKAAFKKVGKTWVKGIADLEAVYSEFAKLRPPADLKNVHA